MIEYKILSYDWIIKSAVFMCTFNNYNLILFYYISNN